MFLNEVALGKESHITRDDSSLVKPPNGYDCVIAKGSQEPGLYNLTGVLLNFLNKIKVKTLEQNDIS